ncbi:contact-dependent growth inhibition system immunity protein [Enterobacter bugandensis]|uniref:contact-dependent growth inhibition system immunity protein n=1 Tax=Enterobacter bugandensis TaxID=881260 RepID=UPI002FD6DA94
MENKYEIFFNFIRSYFNQDTVYELETDELEPILDLYLSEVNQDGVKELFIDISDFLLDNKLNDLDTFFKKEFYSYLDLTPFNGFLFLLIDKYSEKYLSLDIAKHTNNVFKIRQKSPLSLVSRRKKRAFSFLPSIAAYGDSVKTRYTPRSRVTRMQQAKGRWIESITIKEHGFVYGEVQDDISGRLIEAKVEVKSKSSDNHFGVFNVKGRSNLNSKFKRKGRGGVQRYTPIKTTTKIEAENKKLFEKLRETLLATDLTVFRT